MGKNHRHQKTLKSEKAKVKLKLKSTKTKFLPKGGNVTDTNFKIKPIVIPEQLKFKSGDEALSRRNLNLKDLLKRLKHYNATVKYEGCKGLLEIISYSREVLLDNLGQLLRSACDLILDVDQKVRREAIKLVSTILQDVSVQNVTPFFHILSTYVRCAMTNIDRNVQEDSLLLVDSLVKHTPSLLAENSEKVLSNFFTLLSKLRSDSKPGRTVAISLGSKITSVKWRIKVLSRLQALLDAVVSYRNSEQTSSTKGGSLQNHIVYEAANCNTIPVYSSWYNNSFNSHHNYCVTNAAAVYTTTDNNVITYISTLIPLLHETWLEVAPEDNIQNIDEDNTVLTQDAAAILGCVLNIFHHLLEFVKIEMKDNEDFEISTILEKTEVSQFIHSITKYFPYCQNDAVRQKRRKDFKKLLQENYDPQCIRENLLTCYFFSIMHKKLIQKTIVTKANSVVNYVNKCLVNRNYITQENVEHLALVVKHILLKNSYAWSKKNIDINKIIENLVHFCKFTKLPEGAKDSVLNILYLIVEQPHLSGLPAFEKWLKMLPLHLCQPEIPETIINTLSILARKNNDLVQQAVAENLPQILDNLPTIKIIGVTDEKAVTMKIVSLFYYNSYLNVDSVKRFISNNEYRILAQYIQQTLALKEQENLY